jgi:hypothetical protein
LLPVLPLRYEDLLADPEHQFRRLATFLNLAAGSEALALALEETRFKALRAKEEAAGGFVENSPHQERFFRSGRSGEGRERLSADQLAGLGARLKLPAGWTFSSRVLDAELEVRDVDGVAVVVQDDFENTYQLEA